MKNAQLIAAASLLALCACATTPPVATTIAEAPQPQPAVPAPLTVIPTGGFNKLAPVRMDVDTSYLTAEQRQVVNLLIQAAELMNPIYLQQNVPGGLELRRQVAAMGDPQLLQKFDTMMGPWDELEEDAPFLSVGPKPSGAGFYPPDITKEDFEAYLVAHPEQREALTSPYAMVRPVNGRLTAIPYSTFFREHLEPAAKLMEQAAAITTNPSLKRFLTLRAQAFRTDDYYQSEMAWMDLKDTPIEFVIGPYETYTDELHGRKTAYEAYVTLRNPKESAALDVYKSHLRAMEANLPVEERYKNFQRGFESPISVVDQIKGTGDAAHGVQAIAFNLPNDERVREAKGAKKVILQNVLNAKYEGILRPMAPLIFVPADAANVTARYMFMETLFHELSHSLGPGTITVNGRKTTVDAELKDLHSGIEEAKADVMGAYNIMYMMNQGVLPKSERDQIRATYLAGLFRAMRFGTNSAHGRGAAMQYGYMRNKGAIVWDPQAQRFRIDETRIDGAIRDLVGEIVRRQGDGDYAATKAFLDQWGSLDAEAKQVIGTMTHIPVDIRPIYPDRV